VDGELVLRATAANAISNPAPGAIGGQIVGGSRADLPGAIEARAWLLTPVP